MSNEHIARATKYLESATGGRDVSQTKKVVRISGNYRGAVDTMALLSIAESLLAIAESMNEVPAVEDELQHPEILGLKLKKLVRRGDGRIERIEQ